MLQGLSREDGNPWVITSPKPGEALSDVYDQLHRIRCRAGIKDVRLHDLRHSHASHAIINDGSLHMAGRLLGHRRATTTNRYVHLDDSILSEVAERVAGVVEKNLFR